MASSSPTSAFASGRRPTAARAGSMPSLTSAPPLPSPGTSLLRTSLSRSKSSGPGSMGGRGGPTNSAENLAPRVLGRVAREVRNLLRDPPGGVRLVLDPETGMPPSLDCLVAEIAGPAGTPYESRYFQLKLVLSADFPSSPPRGYFLTKIYHPNVDSHTGAICVNTLKRDWTPATTMGHVLGVIRCLLIVPFPESSLNDEAGRLFMDSYAEYARRARLLADVHGRPESFDAEFGPENDAEDLLGEDKGDGEGGGLGSAPSSSPALKKEGGGGAAGEEEEVLLLTGGAGVADSSSPSRSLKRGVSSPLTVAAGSRSNSENLAAGGGAGGGGAGGGGAPGKSLSPSSKGQSSSSSVPRGLGRGGASLAKKTAETDKKKQKKKSLRRL